MCLVSCSVMALGSLMSIITGYVVLFGRKVRLGSIRVRQLMDKSHMTTTMEKASDNPDGRRPATNLVEKCHFRPDRLLLARCIEAGYRVNGGFCLEKADVVDI